MIAARHPGLRLRSSLARLVCLALFLGFGGSLPAAASAATGPVSSAAAAGAFLSNLDDIPLMPGLTERKDLAVSFDKPEGRIVEAFAEGRLSPGAVTKFYATTLPQLGWHGAGNNRFAREGEELLLNVTSAAGKLTVQFSLSPRP